MKNQAAFYARVTGLVQGVGFRYSALSAAKRLSLCGWVRNAADGAVEVWAEGPPENLSSFQKWLKHGPQFSRVDFVDITDTNPRGYREFVIEH